MKLSEAKRVIEIIKVSQAKIDMVEPILDMVTEEPEVKKPAAKAPTKTGEPEKVKREYTFKPKSCESCGREFVPHYGAQKICDECKDIKDTANDMLGIEE